MILGLMQPYFFPYLGYFDLINYSNQWIVFDTVSYIKRGWINRNRILHPKEGWQHIVVPVKKNNRGTAIKDIEIASDNKWRRRILGQIAHYKKKAPYFVETYELVDECLRMEEGSISRLNIKILEKVCRYVDVPFGYKYLSEMDLELGPIKAPGDWALRIAVKLGAKEYVNPPGGRELYDSSKFEAAGIKLTIRDIEPLKYTCRNYQFIERLSIIDVLMWNSAEKVKEHLDRVKSD